MRLLLSYAAIVLFRVSLRIGRLGEAALDAAEARRDGAAMLPAQRLLITSLTALSAAALWIVWTRSP